MGVGCDRHRSSSEDVSSGPSHGGGPQCNSDPGVDYNLEEHDCSMGAASSTKKKKSIGGGSGGRGAKSRVRVSDDQAPGAGAKARRGRRTGKKRSRKRISDDEEEEVMPQRKRRGSAVELGDENFIKKEVTEESGEEDEASAKKNWCEKVERLKNVITNREVAEEAGEIVAEKDVEKFNKKERTAGKKKLGVEVEKKGKAAELGDEKFIKKEIAEKSDEEDELSSKKKRWGEAERQKDVIIKREVDEEAGEVAVDKRAERFHQKGRTARKKKRQVKFEKNGKAAQLGDEIFLKEEIAEKSNMEDVLSAKKKRRGEAKRLKNATTKWKADEEAEELVVEKCAEKFNEKERTTGRKKRPEVEKMGKDSGKIGVDDEDDGVLEDKNLTGAAKNVGDLKSSRKHNKKSSEEGGFLRKRGQRGRGQRGKGQQLGREIRQSNRKVGNMMAEEAMEEIEQDTEMEVTELY